MVQLQPRLPGRRKHKHERKESAEEPSSRDWGMVYWIIAVAVVVVIVIVIVMTYSAPPSVENVLSDAQVIEELTRVRGMSMYPANLNLNPADYPRVFGKWNNFTLEERYFCSDVCPDYGRVDLVFKWVGAEQCESVGGRALRDMAWGGYLGCQPNMG